MAETRIDPGFLRPVALQHFPAAAFPTHRPVPWFTVHLATGGWSPLHIVSGLFTAHMTTSAPRRGLGWHTHQNEETYTWMLDGVLRHSDSAGGSGEIRPGELQRMFAGAGIAHISLGQYDVTITELIQLSQPSRGCLPPYACCAASTRSISLSGFAAPKPWVAPHSGDSPL
jgi:hypothetical protein